MAQNSPQLVAVQAAMSLIWARWTREASAWDRGEGEGEWVSVCMADWRAVSKSSVSSWGRGWDGGRWRGLGGLGGHGRLGAC